jgi:hypothetical protein
VCVLLSIPSISTENLIIFFVFMAVRRIWGLPVFLPLFGGDCSFHYGRVSMRGSHVSVEEEVHEACSLMLQQVHMLCTSKKVSSSLK